MDRLKMRHTGSTASCIGPGSSAIKLRGFQANRQAVKMLPFALDIAIKPHKDIDIPQCYSQLGSKANDTQGVGSPVQRRDEDHVEWRAIQGPGVRLSFLTGRRAIDSVASVL